MSRDHQLAIQLCADGSKSVSLTASPYFWAQFVSSALDAFEQRRAIDGLDALLTVEVACEYDVLTDVAQPDELLT